MRVGKVMSMVVVGLVALALPYEASAQQERQVGRKGATQLSFDVSVSATQSAASSFGTEQSWSGDYTFFIESGKFMTDHVVLTVGTFVGGGIGEDSVITSGVNGGLRYYMTPGSTVSPYVSGGAGIFSSHAEGFNSNAGTLLGAFGVDAAVRDNAMVYFEGQYQRLMFEGGSQNGIRFKVGLRVLF